jgi:hypothetical protein
MLPQRALLPDFEEDIFITYDHDDNQPPVEDFTGFVDRIDEFLNKRLAMLFGEQPKIWRDKLLKGNELLNDTIVIRLSKTALLVCVLSPAYVKSEWCRKELNEFYERAAKNRGIRINNRSRIFKVIKTPIGADPLEGSGLSPELKTVFQESLGYQFYERDKAGRFREFWPEYGREYAQKCLATLEDLAQDINEFIKFDQELQKCIGKCVYLSETTPELANERNEIKRTLQQHGYRVMPEEELPFDNDAFEAKVKTYLNGCSLSIHLVGSDFTTIRPEKAEELLDFNTEQRNAALRVRKQHQLALCRGEGDPRYSRLIWMPAGLSPREPENQEFLAYLQNDPAVQENADILNGSKLEDLKTIIQRRLKVSWEENTTPDRAKRIYLICDKQDKDAVAPVKQYLKDNGYEVLLPFDEGDQVSNPHTENLRVCDAILVFYGTHNTMTFKLAELRKVNVNRASRPLAAQGIYVAGPATEHKQTFATAEALVMKCFGEFSADSIKPFLEQLEKTDASAAA